MIGFRITEISILGMYSSDRVRTEHFFTNYHRATNKRDELAKLHRYSPETALRYLPIEEIFIDDESERSRNGRRNLRRNLPKSFSAF